LDLFLVEKLNSTVLCDWENEGILFEVRKEATKANMAEDNAGRRDKERAWKGHPDLDDMGRQGDLLK
jgi:hypothetical protein